MSEKNVKSAEVIADDVISYLKQAMEEDRRRERPDYSNTVYCDRHLGVKMLLADTWTANEWSSPKKDAWADANPNFLWICPKPDCDRHYEPMMFGYHINEPGRRLDDAAKQPRGNQFDVALLIIFVAALVRIVRMEADGSNLIRLPTAKANELPAGGDTSGLDYS
jgi:hypothetical protein